MPRLAWRPLYRYVEGDMGTNIKICIAVRIRYLKMEKGQGRMVSRHACLRSSVVATM